MQICIQDPSKQRPVERIDMENKNLDNASIVRTSRFLDENTFKHAVIYEKNIERNDSTDTNSSLKKEKEKFIDN